jgi:hypothetical protein
MPRRRAGLKAVIAEITQGADRSSLFWWLVEHHDELVEASRGRRLQWEALCKRFETLGLTDRTGKPASARVARLTWERARKVVARACEAEANAPPKRLLPSRLPKDWRPMVVEVPVTRVPAPVPCPAVLPSVAVSGRSYELPKIADEDLDLSLAPETYEDNGQILPMPLEARRRFARIKMQLAEETKRKFPFGVG